MFSSTSICALALEGKVMMPVMMMGWMKRTMKLCIWGMLQIVQMMEGALEKLEDGKETIPENLLQTEDAEERMDKNCDYDLDKKIKQERMIKLGADWICQLKINQSKSSSRKNKCKDPKGPCVQQSSTGTPDQGLQMLYLSPPCKYTKPTGLLPCWLCGVENPDHLGRHCPSRRFW